MFRRCFYLAAIGAFIALTPQTTFARDILKEIVCKAQLSSSDVATIKTVVAQRSKDVVDAAKDPQRLKAAREALLETARVAKATKAGLNAYAAACSDELGVLLTHQEQAPAVEAILVLVELKNAETTNALATGLISPYAAVRYRAARGIQLLHKDIAKNEQATQLVLRTLGRAGAAEKNEHVLRIIYKAIDFRASGVDAKYSNNIASALNMVFESRLEQLKADSNDLWKDDQAFAAAENCFPQADKDQQRMLVLNVAGFIKALTDAYCDGDTARPAIKNIKRMTQEAEDSLHAMIKAAGKSVPSTSINKAMESKKATKSSREATRAAYDALTATLKASPWNMP